MRARSVIAVVTAKQREVLEAVVRMRLASQQLVERCRIVLMSAEGRENENQARELGVDRQRIRRWRHRWARASEALAAAESEGATDKDLEKLIIAVFSDDERSGAPPKFRPEQVASIMRWRVSGRPIVGCLSHTGLRPSWREKRSSERSSRASHRGRSTVFCEADLRPHKNQYWLTSPDKREAPEQNQADVEKICDTYRQAPQLAAEGTHVVSTDEKTGVQALE